MGMYGLVDKQTLAVLVTALYIYTCHNLPKESVHLGS